MLDRITCEALAKAYPGVGGALAQRGDVTGELIALAVAVRATRHDLRPGGTPRHPEQGVHCHPLILHHDESGWRVYEDENDWEGWTAPWPRPGEPGAEIWPGECSQSPAEAVARYLLAVNGTERSPGVDA